MVRMVITGFFFYLLDFCQLVGINYATVKTSIAGAEQRKHFKVNLPKNTLFEEKRVFVQYYDQQINASVFKFVKIPWF